MNVLSILKVYKLIIHFVGVVGDDLMTTFLIDLFQTPFAVIPVTVWDKAMCVMVKTTVEIILMRQNVQASCSLFS
jgi:hypothetical protein